MNCKLTIQERLKDLREERGLTLSQLSEQMQIPMSTLGSYETDDQREIGHSMIARLCQFYGVTADYLLGLSEQRAGQTEKQILLSDDAIKILERREVNPLLLSELIAHPKFKRLMVDTEIYVDGIAASNIRNLNLYYAEARQKIEAQYHPDADERYFRELEVLQVDEHQYFANIIHNDMDYILQDIRENHKFDSDTAADETLAEQALEMMRDADQIHGSSEEELARMWCRNFYIDYDKLTPLEFASLVSMLKKSKLAGVKMKPGEKRKMGMKKGGKTR